MTLKLFAPLYERAIRWAGSRHAPWMLFVLSIAEAVFFPIMPEIMLAPMALARPNRAFRYAAISLAGSMIGAVVGYWLGQHAWEFVKPLLAHLHMVDKVDAGITTIRARMAESPWGVFWFLVLGGFMPIPMKVFTWASGIVGVPWLQYLLAMTVGRGKRVFLLALAIRLGGERAELALRRWIEPIGWIATALLVALVAYFYFRSRAG